jgi:hypothetical protein
VYANRKPNDAVMGSQETQWPIAKFAAGDDVVGYAGEVEEWLVGCVCEGDDAAFGDLVEDGGTCGGVLDSGPVRSSGVLLM